MAIKRTESNAINANTAIGNNRRIILTKPYPGIEPDDLGIYQRGRQDQRHRKVTGNINDYSH